MLQLGRLYYTSTRFDLLASLGRCNSLFIGKKITKQLAFLIIFSASSMKNIAQTSSHSLWPNHLIFTIFHFSTSVSSTRSNGTCGIPMCNLCILYHYFYFIFPKLWIPRGWHLLGLMEEDDVTLCSHGAWWCLFWEMHGENHMLLTNEPDEFEGLITPASSNTIHQHLQLS